MRRELPRWGGQKPRLRMVRAVFTALTDPTGVAAQRPGALERAGLLLEDWRDTQRRPAGAETRMLAILDELHLTDLVTSIDGLSAVGAAAILAETGELSRFATGRAVVKHAGLAPRERLSGNYTGRTRIGRQGRPALRLAAWRAARNLALHNPVFAAKFTHLTTRDHNQLNAGQAYAAIAAALLRQLHAVVTRRQRWDPAIAAGGRDLEQAA